MPVDNTCNKRIAKNSIMLYLRMLFSMIVGLYTSRVVLQTLGVEDYGIYGVVGGIVSMMGFLNASMAGATSRFLTFELGRGDMKRLTKTFSSAMIAHVLIAIIILVLAETFGLWFLCHKLVIPEERMFAAHVVFQFSILSALFSITQVPYNSSIISHEKLDIFAYVEMCNVVLKLAIVYLLMIGNFDKLILYALLTLVVSLTIMIIYRVYCIRHFEECHFFWTWDREYLKPLLCFSGLDLYGNMTSTVVSQGRTFILNIFFGVTINAAAGIATTIQGVLQGFSGNIIQAIRPQIIKAYSVNDINRMQFLLNQGVSFSVLLLLVISVPFITEIDFILDLWLEEVPVYAGSFCQWLLVFNVLKIISTFFVIGIHACGKVECFLYTGTVSMLQIFAMYLLFRFTSLPPQWTFILMIIWGIIDISLLFYLVKREIPEFNEYSFLLSVLKVMGVIFVSIIPVFFIVDILETGFARFIAVGITYLFCSFALAYFGLLPKTTRKMVIYMLRRRLHV